MSSDATDPNTEALADDARDGDVAAFVALYERVAPALYAWASLRIRPVLRKTYGPEDLVQEVWGRAFEALDRFDAERASFRSWAFTIATRLIANRTRDARRFAGQQPLPSSGELPEDMTRVSEVVARDEQIAKVIERVRTMPQEQRELFLLCGLEGAPTTEAAEVLNISKEAARKRWQRLRAELRDGAPAELLAD